VVQCVSLLIKQIASKLVCLLVVGVNIKPPFKDKKLLENRMFNYAFSILIPHSETFMTSYCTCENNKIEDIILSLGLNVMEAILYTESQHNIKGSKSAIE